MYSCADDFIGGVWIELPLSLFPVIILQIIWLLHSIYSEHIARQTTLSKSLSAFQRTLYLSMQIIGLFYTIMEVFRFVVDPHTLILRDNIGCFIAAYTPKVVPGLFYGLYLYQILLRLEASFKDSPLALSKRSIFFYKLLIIPIVTGPIWFLILNQGDPACVRGWKANDFPSWYERPKPHKFAYCALKTELSATVFLIVMVAFFSFLNIGFGVIFALKLKILLSNTVHQDMNVTFAYKSLIVRNSILTLTGSISTVVGYLLWITVGIGGPQFVDIIVNCLVIGLMVNYNTKIYKRLCKCCIVMCFVQCDKSESKLTEEDVTRYINDDIPITVVSDGVASRSASPKVELENTHAIT